MKEAITDRGMLMPLISDNYHKEKLKKYNINIKTKYIVGNNILERNTNEEKNDDITSGIRCEKKYYVNNILKHVEKLFDSRIEYTFISPKQIDDDYECPNCGMVSKLRDFIDGCPYCNTYYNIDYSDKDLGGKYHYDHVIHSNIYRFITAIIDLIISLIISYFFIKYTSRTFNSIDILKVLVYGIILSLILYYLFYTIDAYIVIGPIKKYKERQNKEQILFWERTKINKKAFFNNLNYEIRKYYYEKPDVIDYDILDYEKFSDYVVNSKQYVDVHAQVRIVYYHNNKIVSKIKNETYTMYKNVNGTMKVQDGVNIIMCHNCGASLDINKAECDYCHTKIKYLQEWILDKKKDE